MSKLFRKVVISKYSLPLENIYKYNAQLWLSLDNHNWYYCGMGRFCKTIQEALRYKREQEMVV